MTKHADRDRSEAYWPPAAAAAYDQPVPYVPTERADGARALQYAAAMAHGFGYRYASVVPPAAIRAVMAVADAEQAELRAALLRVRAFADAFANDGLPRDGGNISWHIEEAIANEKGDFPDAADQRIASQRDRAEAAERALADERAKVAQAWDDGYAMASDDFTHSDYCGLTCQCQGIHGQSNPYRATTPEPETEPCPHTCSCTSDMECPHDCPCDAPAGA